MVFEFTGKPPAFGTPTTFASFTPTPTVSTPTRSSFVPASFGGYFGGGAFFQQNSSSSTPFGTVTTPAQASRDPTHPSEDVSQDDDLMRALKRCATNRQAVFGIRDMNADAALNEVLGLCDLDAGKLMEEMREASSEVGMFARAAFITLLKQHQSAKLAHSTPVKAAEKVPRWLSGEKRKKSMIPQPVAKRAKGEEAKEKNDEEDDAAMEVSNDSGAEPTTAPTPATPAKPFRFLALPAEMRNIVYRELLVSRSGYIFLAGRPYQQGDTAAHKFQPDLRKGLESGCDSAILETCKQIYDEAKDMLSSENKVIMSFEVEKSIKPFLPMYRICASSLARITSLVLVLDMCAASSLVRNHRVLSVQDFEKLVCWRELQSMTGLKSLHLTIVERAEIEHRRTMLIQIMERIPATCQVAFGMETDFERAYVQKVIRDADEPVHKAYYNVEDSYEANVDTVRRCGQGAMATKGCKSGDDRDYRFPDRSFSNKLGSLAGSEAIDPRYVLGGGDATAAGNME